MIDNDNEIMKLEYVIEGFKCGGFDEQIIKDLELVLSSLKSKKDSVNKSSSYQDIKTSRWGEE